MSWLPALAIDTSTEDLSLAVSRAGGEPAERLVTAGRRHLELLLPEIDSLLRQEGLEVAEIDCLAVGTGPGAFSGLRVGIATARALAQALEVPLYGGGTLEALARGLASGPEAGARWLLPLIDAKRGQVFTRLYRKEGDRVLARSETLCLDPGELPGALKLPAGERALAGGNGALAWHELLSACEELEVLPGEDPRHRVRAAHFLRLAVPDAFRMADLLKVMPLYVRGPDADKTVLTRKREPWL